MPLPSDLKLASIWEKATWGAGHLGDAIQATKRQDPTQVIKDLGEALILLNKATAEIQQLLATR